MSVTLHNRPAGPSIFVAQLVGDEDSLDGLSPHALKALVEDWAKEAGITDSPMIQLELVEDRWEDYRSLEVRVAGYRLATEKEIAANKRQKEQAAARKLKEAAKAKKKLEEADQRERATYERLKKKFG